MNLSLQEKSMLAIHRVNQLQDGLKAMSRAVDYGCDQRRVKLALLSLVTATEMAVTAVGEYKVAWREVYDFQKSPPISAVTESNP